jgi:hypothetical protein
MFCQIEATQMYMLPSFGLADRHGQASVACGKCYQQLTFTAPRPAARVVLSR